MYVNIACNSKLNCETVKGKLKGKFQVSEVTQQIIEHKILHNLCFYEG